MIKEVRSIAIVGAGFSGTLVAIHLLRHAVGGDRIYLAEKSPLSFGRGVAYDTENPSHLLNVHAGGMSAFEEEPLDFVAWLNSEASEDMEPLQRPVPPESFVPRRLYGRYLQHCLHDVLPKTRAGNHLIPTNEVFDIVETRDGLLVLTRGGRCVPVDCAVLAIGNIPPDRSELPHYVGDPWSEAAIRDLDPAADIAIIGTGPTMVDTVMSLLDQGHAGRIYAISRRWQLPRVHTPVGAVPPWQLETPLPSNCLALLRAVRAEIARATALGRSWQDVFHALRPHLQTVWKGLPFEERERFLRHLRPWWDAHRHRVPPEVGARIDRLLRTGQLRVVAGQIEERTLTAGAIEVRVRRRGTAAAETLQVARVINCSGPQTDFNKCEHALVRNLLSRGEARTDLHGLGLDVDESCAVLDQARRPSGRLFAVGPVTRGRFWEITSVPEIRRQCATLAQHLMYRPTRPAPAFFEPWLWSGGGSRIPDNKREPSSYRWR